MTERPMGIPKLSCLLSVSVDSVCGKWPQYLPPAPGVCDPAEPEILYIVN